MQQKRIEKKACACNIIRTMLSWIDAFLKKRNEQNQNVKFHICCTWFLNHCQLYQIPGFWKRSSWCMRRATCGDRTRDHTLTERVLWWSEIAENCYVDDWDVIFSGCSAYCWMHHMNSWLVTPRTHTYIPLPDLHSPKRFLWRSGSLSFACRIFFKQCHLLVNPPCSGDYPGPILTSPSQSSTRPREVSLRKWRV